MNIEPLRFVVDTGLFILIWMVQLVVYPSFLYYKREHLIRWHKKYTTNISILVVPLMLSQLVLAVFEIFTNYSLLTILYFLLVICSWLITFLIFVPIHSKISTNTHTREILKKLVSYNWLRTIIWSIIMVVTFINIF